MIMAKLIKLIQALLLAAALTASSSCLQAVYEDMLLDFIPPPPGNITSRIFAADGHDVLIVNLSGARFLETIEETDFSLSSGTISGLRLDTDTTIILGCDPALPAADYRLTVNASALDRAASSLVVRAEKSGIWTAAAESGFGTSRVWNIAYGNGRFAAVAGADAIAFSAANPDTGKIAWSVDGISWNHVPRGLYTSGFEQTIRGVAWGNRAFWAAGYGARMGNSGNGIQWTGWDETSFGGAGGSSILSVIYGGNRFAAAASDGSIVYIWNDQTRTKITSTGFDPGESIHALAYGRIKNATTQEDEDAFVAAGAKGKISQTRNTLSAFYLETGDSHSTDTFSGTPINALAFGNEVFVAAGSDGKLAWSDNTYNWNLVDSTFGGSDILNIACNGRMFIAVGAAGKMASSTDGKNWTAIDPGTGAAQNKFTAGEDIHAICYGGGKFVAAGKEPGKNTRIIYSYQKP
jgi:WD40 repeat protein